MNDSICYAIVALVLALFVAAACGWTPNASRNKYAIRRRRVRVIRRATFGGEK